ncbi:MAG: hypothetical protein PHF64_03300 [Methanoregula sp.]|nr:hypothetical protein [Methanoregula sp.]
MSDYTGRFQWPIPPWNSDWQKWQQMFASFAQGVDATAFALLEHITVLPRDLPTVQITNPAPGSYYFTQAASARFLSRSMQSEIEVTAVAAPGLALVPGALICVNLQPGAVGPQTVEWELYVSQTPIDSSIVPLGVVFDDYSIIWFNGNHLAVGVVAILFEGTTGAGISFMSGAGNPNGVVLAVAGTTYYDNVAGLLYMNIDSVTTWVVS